jgi:sporulation protein YtfJ
MNEQKTPNGKTKVGAVLDVTVDKMRAMADSSTIIGDPIVVNDVTMIPVSKVSYGFASGGSEFASQKSAHGLFAGGGGGGMTVTLVAFLVVDTLGEVKLLNVAPSETAMGAAERAIAMAPDLIEQVKNLFQKDKKQEDQ